MVEDLISTGGSVLGGGQCPGKPGAQVLGIVSIFTYGMAKGLKRLAEAQVKHVSLTNFDVIAQVAAEEHYIRPQDVARPFPSGTTLGRELIEVQNEKKCHQHSGSVCGGVDELIATANDIIENPKSTAKKCRGLKLATLFSSPPPGPGSASRPPCMSWAATSWASPRPRQLRCQGRERGRYRQNRLLLCRYHRHAPPQEGAPLVAAMNASVPVINAGDGGHNHPTQTPGGSSHHLPGEGWL